MNIGYGINRRVTDFAKADIDLDGFGGLRVWVDTDEKVRPEFSSMLMALIEGDAVFVLSLADLGKGFDLAENKRKIEAHGAVVSLVDDASPPPEPRKPGPKPRWPSIPADVVKAGAEKWHMPDVFTWQAAIKVFHDAGFKWVTRATLNDNIGTRSAPKSKGAKIMSQPAAESRDMFTVFCEALEGADRVVVETKNALGEMDAHYLHAPELRKAIKDMETSE